MQSLHRYSKHFPKWNSTRAVLRVMQCLYGSLTPYPAWQWSQQYMYISLAPQNCHILQQTCGTVQNLISLLTYVSQTILPRRLSLQLPQNSLASTPLHKQHHCFLLLHVSILAESPSCLPPHKPHRYTGKNSICTVWKLILVIFSPSLWVYVTP